MRKFLALLSVLFVILVGCSNGGGSSSSDTSGSDNGEQTETADNGSEESSTTEEDESSESEGTEGDYGDLTIRVGTSGTSDVFSVIDPDTEEWQGIDADVWRAIEEETGWTIELSQTQFDGLIGELQSDRIDAVSNHMGETEERNEQALPSEPYSSDAAVIIINSENTEINSVEDLAGKTVGVKSGQSVQPIVVELSEEIGFTVNTYQENPEMYSDLAMGRTDAIVGMQASIESFSEDLNIDLKEVGDPLQISEVVFYLQNNGDGQALADQLNPVIEKLREEGVFSEITLNWTGYDLPANLQ